MYYCGIYEVNKFKILILTEIAVITVDLSSEGCNRRSTQFFL